jgi:hypothetical protein
MGINQIDIEIKSLRIKFASVPIFNVTKREVDITSKKTEKNNNKTGKSMVYVNLCNVSLRLFTILFFK